MHQSNEEKETNGGQGNDRLDEKIGYSFFNERHQNRFESNSKCLGRYDAGIISHLRLILFAYDNGIFLCEPCSGLRISGPLPGRGLGPSPYCDS